MTGGQAMLEIFLREGVDTIFGYPGGQIMPFYDALYDYTDRINHILMRHEQGAVHAAQGYARTSGKIGICTVTSGPGATNTITGLADAMIDSTPVIVVSGQVPNTLLGSDAFQEVNFVGLSQVVTKWTCQIKHAAEIPEVMAKAFYIARSGRPGPVSIDFTKNAQLETIEFDYRPMNFIRGYIPSPEPDLSQIEMAAKLISEAKHPLALVGQGVTLAGAEKVLGEFLAKSGVPAACTMLGLSAVPTTDSHYVGMLGMHGNYGPNIKNSECDLLIALGMRFDDRVTCDPTKFGVNARVIHFEIDPAEINKIIYADAPVVGDIAQTLPMVTERIKTGDHTEWTSQIRQCNRQEYDTVVRAAIHPESGRITMGEVVDAVSTAYGDDAVLVTDVGQQQLVAARYFRFSSPRSIVTSGGLGTMGFGLPAAIGAKIGAPSRNVCLFVGDGGLQMTIEELTTIMQSEVDVKIVLLNNYYLGNVRQWQEMFFGHRYSFTELDNPDFGLVARANKIEYGVVEKREELASAIERMTASHGAFLLEVRVEREENVLPMVAPGAGVSDMMLEYKRK